MQIFRYVTFHCADDYLRLGWVPRFGLHGTHHGHWSILMEWIDCGCKCVEPQR